MDVKISFEFRPQWQQTILSLTGLPELLIIPSLDKNPEEMIVPRHGMVRYLRI